MPGAMPVSWWRSSDDREGDRDVAPGGVGVRADLVRLGDELFRGWPVDVRDAYLQVDGEAEPSVVQRAEANAGDDLSAVDVELVLPADHLERGMEAGGVAGREQHLGVRGAACATHLLGDPHVDVEDAILAAGMAVAAVAGGMGGGRVQDVHQSS